MRKIIKRGIRIKALFVLAAALFLSSLSLSFLDARADEAASVSLKYPITDVSFSLYEVGSVNSDGAYVLNEIYEKYQVNMQEKTAASTLAAYIRRDRESDESIKAIATVSSKELSDGSIEASFTGLSRGLYLLIGERASDDTYIYTPQDIFVSLPMQKDGELYFDVSIENKYEQQPVDNPESSDSELSVMKIWKNDQKKGRPASVTVELLINGKSYDEALEADASEKEKLDRVCGSDGSRLWQAVLSEDNNWTFTWTNLSADDSWTIVEKEVPAGYTVSSSRDDDMFVLTNTGKKPDKPDEPELPHTGLLWWPIPTLIAGGLFFILIGLLIGQEGK